jgi:hypothetical protein
LWDITIVFVPPDKVVREIGVFGLAVAKSGDPSLRMTA